MKPGESRASFLFKDNHVLNRRCLMFLESQGSTLHWVVLYERTFHTLKCSWKVFSKDKVPEKEWLFCKLCNCMTENVEGMFGTYYCSDCKKPKVNSPNLYLSKDYNNPMKGL